MGDPDEGKKTVKPKHDHRGGIVESLRTLHKVKNRKTVLSHKTLCVGTRRLESQDQRGDVKMTNCLQCTSHVTIEQNIQRNNLVPRVSHQRG